jgi:predicted RNA binding protein YcfA (HicA-like mRNA interferase family)
MERDSKRIVARLQREGWVHVATKGSHTIFKKDGRHVTVPHPRKDLPIGTARDIARKAGWL